MLVFATWLWGSKYPPVYVERLFAAVRRNLKDPDHCRFMVMTERGRNVRFSAEIERHAIKDEQLADRSCFCRLRMWDEGWQQNRKLYPGDRLVCLDLDNVICGPLDELFDRKEDFVILQGVNAVNPCPYNCSVFMLRAGTNGKVWTSFSREAADQIPKLEWADDQGWLAEVLPNAAAFGPSTGIYGLGKPGWPKGLNLPCNARIVAFPGARDPNQFTRLDWVRNSWGPPLVENAA